MRGYEFTEDDEGKDVVTQAGTYVGSIAAVDVGDNASIDRSAGDILTERLKDLLGWDDEDDERHDVVRGADVEESSDDRIHLRY